MSWITLIGGMVASACLTLAAVHLLVWRQQRGAWHHGLFALSAVGTAALAANELWLMRAPTAEEMGQALRWGHVPFWVVMVSLVGFVRVYMRAGRRWLAWAVCGLRTLSLILNFLFSPNLNFLEITGFRTVPFLGESVNILEGVRNPWMLVGQLSLLLLLIFMVDATLTVWRRGERRSMVVLGASIVFFFGASSAQFVLSLWGLITLPMTPSLFFLGIIAVMSFELSRDVLRASVLARDLRESEQRVALATNAANLGLWMRTGSRNDIWANDRFKWIFGLPTGEAVTLDAVLARLHPGDRETTRRALERSMEEQADYAVEFRVDLPDGGSRWVAAQGNSRKLEETDEVRTLGVCMDITQRKIADAEAVRQRAELAHFGRVSTMGQLASTIAHELNQPLGAILRNAEAAELLLRRSPPDLLEVGAILEDIRRDDRRAGEVIDRMRELLKRRQPHRALVRLDELVDDVMVLLQPDALSRGVTLQIDVPRTLPRVRVDRVQLQQVFLNLILNGMDAMSEVPPEERLLVVRARRTDGRTLEVEVEDAGRGIPEAKLARLFEPFFTTKAEGMGLGLPISNTIIEAHGGRIRAESRPTGATFIFTLPVGGSE